MDAEFQNLAEVIHTYHPQADVELLLGAYSLMMDLHRGQLRQSGEPYHVHPVAVAHLVMQLRLDEEAVAAALLHDVVEDTALTVQELEKQLGEPVAALVDGVTKLSKLNFRSREERQAETFRKMILASAKDVRVLLLKLCDRLHNMRTIRHLPRERQKAMAAETMEIYAPLANRLGIHWMKAELEDASLKYLKPEVYLDLKDKLSAKRSERDRVTRKFQSALMEALRASGVRGEILGRSKHFYSIYAKMVRQEIPFERVYDLLGLRVIVDNVEECYHALGVVHTLWKPIQGRIKDYIQLPKPNGYQSLHTAVVTNEGQTIEVQIRTRQMHEIAENGVAAHWKYKEGRVFRPTDADKIEGLKQILELHEESGGSQEFLKAVKMDLYEDTVFVQTPKGDVRALPRGSTPLDFAFSVHTQVAYHCTGARVNNKMVPLDHELADGDQVEILTHPAQKPSMDWLRFLKSPRARLKVKDYLKKTQTETAIRIGTGMLEREFEKFGLNLNKLTKSGDLAAAAHRLKLEGVERLLVQVGNSKLEPDKVVRELVPPEDYEARKHPQKSPSKVEALLKSIGTKSHAGVVIDDLDQLSVHYAHCCNPIHGDAVVGFVSRGRGMTVHVRNCRNALHLMQTEPERIVDVNWDRKVKPLLPVTLEIDGEDRPGMIAEITRSLAEEGINVVHISFGKRPDSDRVDNTVQILAENLDRLQAVLRKLRKLPGVHGARRKAV